MSGPGRGCLTAERRSVFFAVSFYFVVSMVMVLANKTVLNKTGDIPLFFLWMQVAVAVVLLKGFSMAGFFKASPVSFSVLREVWQLIAVNVVGLSFNTLCLKHVDAGFFQVARSLVLPLTVALSWLALGRRSSPAVVTACGVVAAGFLAGVNGEMDLQYSGVLFGLISSMTTAYHSVVIKRAMTHLAHIGTMDMVWLNNVFTLIFLLPVCLVSGELHHAYALFFALPDGERAADNDGSQLRVLFLGTLVTGFFGFAINVAGFLQIKVTSPITHMISSAARGVCQTAIAAVLFNETVSSGRLVGISLVILGSSMYAWVRNKESEAEAKTMPPV